MVQPEFDQHRVRQTLYVHGNGDVDHVSLCSGLQQKLGEKGIRALVVTESGKFLENISKFNSGHVVPVEIYSSRKRESGKIRSADLLAVNGLPRFYKDYDLVLVAVEEHGDNKTIDIRQNLQKESGFAFTFDKGFGVGELLREITDWLDRQTRKGPVWGCVIIGGKSSRMGRPKHLIEDTSGKTWLERTVDVLLECTDQIVIAGKGDLPQSCSDYIHLPDIDGAQGPIAGILSALRWNPDVSWIVAACDMPKIRKEAIEWLLSSRRAGVWGAVPYNLNTQRYEPLLAYYSFHSVALFEKLYHSGVRRISKICDGEKIIFPEIPEGLSSSWRNCNTPDDIDDEGETEGNLL